MLAKLGKIGFYKIKRTILFVFLSKIVVRFGSAFTMAFWIRILIFNF